MEKYKKLKQSLYFGIFVLAIVLNAIVLSNSIKRSIIDKNDRENYEYKYNPPLVKTPVYFMNPNWDSINIIKTEGFNLSTIRTPKHIFDDLSDSLLEKKKK